MSCLSNAVRVAGHALARGENFQDAIVFWYRPETNLSAIPKKFYSALTQAWYIHSLSALRRHVSFTYDHSIEKIFRSLLIPVENDGCFIQKEWGWIVEEYPNAPALYTLNGWLTVIKMIADCQPTLASVGVHTDKFLRENIKAVKKLLPLYDAGFCSNSRYQLTGFVRIKLVFNRQPSGVLESFSVRIPGEGIFQGEMKKGNSRWKYYLERDDGRVKQFNVLLSLVSFPENNTLTISYRSNMVESAKVYVAQGGYDPSLTGMPTTGWREIGEIEFRLADGVASIDLPWDDECLFAYPTNFKKKLGGKNFNAYHYIHIDDLAWLYAYTGDPEFKSVALRWFKYVSEWGNLPCLQRPDISFEPLNSDIHGFEKRIQRIFAKQVRKIPHE